MTTPTFSIIVPTTGRSSLEDTLRSLQGQVSEDDQVLLVQDTLDPDSREFIDICAKKLDIKSKITIGDEHPYDWGGLARRVGLELATRDYVVYMDDDDAFASDALEILRNFVSAKSRSPYLFQMKYPDGRIGWTHEKIVLGNVATLMFVHPRRAYRMPDWGFQRTSDFDFISDFIRNNSGGVRWVPEVIAHISPQFQSEGSQILTQPELWLQENFRFHSELLPAVPAVYAVNSEVHRVAKPEVSLISKSLLASEFSDFWKSLKEGSVVSCEESFLKSSNLVEGLQYQIIWDNYHVGARKLPQ